MNLDQTEIEFKEDIKKTIAELNRKLFEGRENRIKVNIETRPIRDGDEDGYVGVICNMHVNI